MLAEASPECYISIIKNTLNEQKEIIECLFNNSNYTYLLNSLELLSADINLFNDVVDILIELNKIEYESQLYNSPFNTLKELFIPFTYNNYPYLSSRLNKLDEILSYNIEIGWKLLEFLLSPRAKTSVGISKPKFLEYNSQQQNIKNEDIINFNSCLEEKSIIFLDEDINKYLFLLERYLITDNSSFIYPLRRMSE